MKRDTYSWNQINEALMMRGLSPARIADIASALSKIKRRDKKTYGQKTRKKWRIWNVFEDRRDAQNAVDDFESQGEKARIEQIGPDKFAVSVWEE